jgi:hypothetical protein
MMVFMLCQVGHLPPLYADDAGVFSACERLFQDHIKMYKTGTAELQEVLQEVLHHSDHTDFDVYQVDTNMHEHLMKCLEAGDTRIEVIDFWIEGDRN